MKSCLIIISLFSGISVFSQNSFDVLKPTRVVNIENSDQYMQKLFTGARAYQNSDTYSKSTITKVQDPNIDVVTTNIQNNPKYNNIVTYLNKTTRLNMETEDQSFRTVWMQKKRNLRIRFQAGYFGIHPLLHK